MNTINNTHEVNATTQIKYSILTPVIVTNADLNDLKKMLCLGIFGQTYMYNTHLETFTKCVLILDTGYMESVSHDTLVIRYLKSDGSTGELKLDEHGLLTCSDRTIYDKFMYEILYHRIIE